MDRVLLIVIFFLYCSTMLYCIGNSLMDFLPHFYRFGVEVMEIVASWTKSLCIEISQGCMPNHLDDAKSEPVEQSEKYLSSWSVLDIGTGNGLLLQELAKQGYSLNFYHKYC